MKYRGTNMKNLLILVISLIGPTLQDCFNGDARLLANNEVQFCYNGNWRAICRNGDWKNEEANVVCGQLGYSNRGAIADWTCQDPNVSGYLRAVKCEGFENNLTECTSTPAITCDKGNGCSGTMRRHGTVECLPANCDDRDIRLVGGSTNREGRVEVCVDRRLGFPAEDAELTIHSIGPIYQCNTDTDVVLACQRITESCERSMGVVCQTHQVIADRSREECQETVDKEVSTCQESYKVRIAKKGSTAGALGGVVAILLALLAVLVVGWTLTCVAIGNRNMINKKQTQNTSTEPSAVHCHPNPVYNASVDTNNYSSIGPTYEVIGANKEATATYSVVEEKNLAPEQIAGNEENTYHVLEAGPGEGVEVGGCDGEGARDYEVPLSRHSQVPLCEQEYSTLKH